MEPSCLKCGERPDGLEGHQSLVLKFAMPMEGKFGKPIFVCAECGRPWQRRYQGDGIFVWTPATGHSSHEVKMNAEWNGNGQGRKESST
jgi:hypothetical protein